VGHTRLGTIPKTRKWAAVVAAVVGNDAPRSAMALADEVEQVADQALDAAEAGLTRAIDDDGLRYSFYLLTQLVLATRHDDWMERLAPYGINLSNDSGIFDLTTEIQGAIDDYLTGRGRGSDIGEMARLAAVDAVTQLAAPHSVTLFGGGAEELRLAVRGLSTKAGFSELGQRFFGNFMTRYLNFYLSRITASELGGGRLQQVGDISAFNAALDAHCLQSARIVRDFCGEWYSSTEFREGITLGNTSNFTAVAVRKLQAELRQQKDAS
jgi:hypothetical protein